MLKYIAIYRNARKSVEWGIDYAEKGSGEILGECPTYGDAYRAAAKYDETHGGDGDIGHRIRHESTGVFCTNINCLAEIPPWDMDASGAAGGDCEYCRHK